MVCGKKAKVEDLRRFLEARPRGGRQPSTHIPLARAHHVITPDFKGDGGGGNVVQCDMGAREAEPGE